MRVDCDQSGLGPHGLCPRQICIISSDASSCSSFSVVYFQGFLVLCAQEDMYTCILYPCCFACRFFRWASSEATPGYAVNLSLLRPILQPQLQFRVLIIMLQAQLYHRSHLSCSSFIPVLVPSKRRRRMISPLLTAIFTNSSAN